MFNDDKIIHVFDDEKFIDPAIEIFEAVYSNSSKYLVVTGKEDKSFIYVKSKLVKPIQLNTESDYISVSNYINKSSSKIVFIHALNARKQKLTELLDKSVTKVWFIWGYDLYYNWKPLKYKIFEKHTLSFVDRNYSSKSRILNMLFYRYNGYKLFKNSKKIFKTSFFKTVQKIDIAVPVLQTEMELIKDINQNIKYAPFTYGCLEHILGDKINSNSLNSKNILVGNSSTPSNNHVEIFKKLAKLDLKEKKVIVPLSYGNKGEYLDFVLKNGKKLLGDNFYPITEFLPLKEYNDLILSCGFAIFNHIRQQAIANIITMGFFGAKLFLNEKSVGYKFYKSIGLNVFLINEMKNESLEFPLTKSQFKNNQQILKDNYSLVKVKTKVENLYRIVSEHSKSE